MKVTKKELVEMIEGIFKEYRIGGLGYAPVSKSPLQLYRKSKYHPDNLARLDALKLKRGALYKGPISYFVKDKEITTKYNTEIATALVPVLQNLHQIPLGKNNEEERKKSVEVARKILNASPTRKQELNLLTNFLKNSGMFPGATFVAIQRGLVDIFNANK